jgi:hypothetical protein
MQNATTCTGIGVSDVIVATKRADQNKKLHWLHELLKRHNASQFARFVPDIGSLVMSCIWMPLTSTSADREHVDESTSYRQD